MARYIDADALKESLKDLKADGNNRKYVQGLQDAIDGYFPQIIDDAPTADVESVTRGRWIHGKCGNDKYIKCSHCRKIIINNIVTLEGDIAETAFVICPRCGAKMYLKEGK